MKSDTEPKLGDDDLIEGVEEMRQERDAMVKRAMQSDRDAAVERAKSDTWREAFGVLVREVSR